MQAKELRDLSDDELNALLEDKAKEGYLNRNAKQVTQDKYKSHELQQSRKTKARIKTLLRERQLKQG
jgi:ribosomal protein L29